mgnify:FL=1
MKKFVLSIAALLCMLMFCSCSDTEPGDGAVSDTAATDMTASSDGELPEGVTYDSYISDQSFYRLLCYDQGAGKESHRLFFTSDCGDSWSEIDTDIDAVCPNMATGIRFFDESTGFLTYSFDSFGFNPAVIMTADGGRTWTKLTRISEFLSDFSSKGYMLEASEVYFENGACYIQIIGTRHDETNLEKSESEKINFSIMSDDYENWTFNDISRIVDLLVEDLEFEPRDFSYLFKNYHYNTSIYYASDDDWQQNICNNFNEHFNDIMEATSCNVLLSGGWEFQDEYPFGYFVNEERGVKIRTNEVDFSLIYYVPVGSFNKQGIDLENQKSERMKEIIDSGWIDEQLLYVEYIDKYTDETKTKYLMVIDELSDDENDCLVYVDVDSDYAADVLDLIESMELIRSYRKETANENASVYKYDDTTLLFVLNDGRGWLYSNERFGYGVQASRLQSGKRLGLFEVTVYDVPYVYTELVDPITRDIIDDHPSEAELARIVGISDYRAFYGFEFADNTIYTYFMTEDSLLHYKIDACGEIFDSTRDKFRFDSELTEDERRAMYDEVIKALGFQTGAAQHYGFARGKSLYFVVERSAMYRYDDFCYYLSSLFTEESVDMILNFTDTYGNPTYVRGDDGLLYISLYIENALPSYDEFDVVWEDDGWKCALK